MKAGAQKDKAKEFLGPTPRIVFASLSSGDLPDRSCSNLISWNRDLFSHRGGDSGTWTSEIAGAGQGTTSPQAPHIPQLAVLDDRRGSHIPKENRFWPRPQRKGRAALLRLQTRGCDGGWRGNFPFL